MIPRRGLQRQSRGIAAAKALLTTQTGPGQEPAQPRLQFLGQRRGRREKIGRFLVPRLGICQPLQPVACWRLCSCQAEQPDQNSSAPMASLAGSPNKEELRHWLRDRHKVLFCCCSKSLKGCEEKPGPNSASSVTGGGAAPRECLCSSKPTGAFSSYRVSPATDQHPTLPSWSFSAYE